VFLEIDHEHTIDRNVWELFIMKFALPCATALAAATLLAPQQIRQLRAHGAEVSTTSSNKAWIEVSNGYTRRLLDIGIKHSPEEGSSEGLAQFDTLISKPTLADQRARRAETEAELARIHTAMANQKDKNVLEDMAIVLKAYDLNFRTENYNEAHQVPFLNATGAIFGGLQILLDAQTPEARRPAAVTRLRKYVGGKVDGETYTPYTDILKQRTVEQMAKKDMVYPSRGEMETELSRNSAYIDGLTALFTKYHLTGWQEPLQQLKAETTAYDTWVRTNLIPRARTDFREDPRAYALDLEGYGVDIDPAKLSQKAHAAFLECQAQMNVLAAQIARAHNYPSSDYRDVIRQLKKQQLVGDAILPFYQARLKAIEDIIVAQKLVTLPTRPAIIRLATAAETVQQPAPHMVPPPFLNNTGQRGEFVLPLNAPSNSGSNGDHYDDFTFDAVAWTMTAHEARPGHELQFDSMLEHGVSQARALYAFNSTNAEGWGLYCEHIMQPFEPIEGQFETLQLRLLRAARAYIDPELQSGKLKPEDAYRILQSDVGLSHAFAQEEVERFTYRSPGQANSYFYGYTRLLELRKETEAALGPKFNQLKFHDFILAQGLLPPDLMRKAVLEDFIPSQN
jgi:Bacterial protein of unknown function (DUF885)